MVDSAVLERPNERDARPYETDERPYESKGHNPHASFDMRHVPLTEIGKGTNPRTRFDLEKMTELTNSIRLMGVIEPIVLRELDDPNEDGQLYTIIAGERRFRAATLVEMDSIPAIIRRCSESEALEMALEENLERDQLNAVEEAHGFAMLMMKGRTQQQIGDRLHKSQSYIANRLRLLQLPEDVQANIINGDLTASHGISLAAISDEPEQVREFRDMAIRVGMSVKSLDNIVQSHKFDKEEAAQGRMDVEPTPAPAQMAEPGPVPEVSQAETIAEEVPAEEIAEAAAIIPAESAPEGIAQSDAAIEAGPDHKADEVAEVAPTEMTAEASPPEILQSPAQSSEVKAAAPPPPPKAATPTPAPAAAAPSLPDGMMKAIVREADYQVLKERGLWPLSAVIKALAEQPAAVPVEAPQAAPALPDGFMKAVVKEADYQALKDRDLWPLAKVLNALAEQPQASGVVISPELMAMAERLTEINRNEETIFTERETDMLDEHFPHRETTTAEHVIFVLVANRTRSVEKVIEEARETVARKAAATSEGVTA